MAPMEIGNLIARTPGILGGKPCIEGHRIGVHRIAGWWKLGLTIEEIEDLTVAVGEACNNAIDHAFDEDAISSGRARIRLSVSVSEQEVRVEVEDQGRGFDPKRLKPREDVPVPASRGLGLYIMRQFVDELRVESSPGSGTKISFVKRSSR